MLIANPIYDAVFKYLLEDMEITRGLLSVILGEEIETLEVKSQETATKSQKADLTILRYDFKAVIKTPTGEHKKILIELEKAKHLLDIMRFRRYLGENYGKADDYQDNGVTKTAPLDIITIYFLGFRLENVPYAVLKANNCYEDVLKGEKLKDAVKEPFVNLLNHEGYFIQIPRLKPELQTRLEKVLLVFRQVNREDSGHELDFKGQADDPLVAKMVHRLHFARADEELQRQILFEDEVESFILEKDLIIELANQRAEENARRAEESDRKAEELNRQAEESNRQAEKYARLLAELQQKLMDKGLDPDQI